MFLSLRTNSNAINDETNLNYLFTCLRRDPGIAWVRFTITNASLISQTLGPIYFPANGNEVQINYSAPRAGSNFLLNVTCQVGAFLWVEFAAGHR